MIEVHLTYEVKPDIDEQVYFEWIKRAIIPALKSQGMVEVRAYNNIKERQGVLVVGLWEKLEHWTAFSQSNGWNSFIKPLENSFATNIHIEVWVPSPLMPVPLRPPRQR